MKLASFEKLWGSRADVNLHHPQTVTAGDTITVLGQQSIFLIKPQNLNF